MAHNQWNKLINFKGERWLTKKDLLWIDKCLASSPAVSLELEGSHKQW